MNILIVVFLLIFSGMFSGLNLGLLSLNPSELERKKKLGDKRAEKIYPIRKDGNLLLCTILLGNVAVNSTMAVFLGDLTTGIIAGVAATMLIVLFGEIIPQAYVSRNALDFGVKTLPIVKFFRFIFYPIAKPLALGLDKALGRELPAIYAKEELAELIKQHEDDPGSTVDRDEERILLGALSYSDKKAGDVMTPKTVVYMLDANRVIDKDLLKEIKTKGFTRIPIYKDTQDEIIGILLVKSLIGFGLKEGKTVFEICRSDSVLQTTEKTKLDELLNIFIAKKQHMAIVSDEFGTLVGIVTLEDIIEEILKKEIVDEDDTAPDMRKVAEEKQAKNNT